MLGAAQVVHHLEAPAAAGPAQRVGRVGHALQLVQHEHRDHQLPVEEAGGHDVADAAVDDRRGVDQQPAALAGTQPLRAAERLGEPPLAESDEPQDLAVVARRDQREHVAEHQEQRQEQVVPDVRQRRDGQRRERRDAEAEQQSDAPDDELARGAVLGGRLHPAQAPDRGAADQDRDDPASKRASDRDGDPLDPGGRRRKIRCGKAEAPGDLESGERSQQGEDEPNDELQPTSPFAPSRLGRDGLRERFATILLHPSAKSRPARRAGRGGYPDRRGRAAFAASAPAMTESIQSLASCSSVPRA